MTYDSDDTPAEGILRPEILGDLDDALEDAAAGLTCDDPHCLVCCDQETFNELTKFKTQKGW